MPQHENATVAKIMIFFMIGTLSELKPIPWRYSHQKGTTNSFPRLWLTCTTLAARPVSQWASLVHYRSMPHLVGSANECKQYFLSGSRRPFCRNCQRKRKVCSMFSGWAKRMDHELQWGRIPVSCKGEFDDVGGNLWTRPRRNSINRPHRCSTCIYHVLGCYTKLQQCGDLQQFIGRTTKRGKPYDLQLEWKLGWPHICQVREPSLPGTVLRP